MSERLATKPNDRRDFRIAVICALTVEADMVESVFDNEWGIYGKAAGDPNTYSTGVIAGHNVVLAYCSSMGSNSATHVAMGLRSSFTGIKIAFVVGICGATHFDPSTGMDIYLGDCVISTAMVQYDLGRHGPAGFQRKSGLENLARANIEIRSTITKSKTRKNTLELERSLVSHLQQLQDKDLERTRYPGKHADRLFEADYVHRHQVLNETCELCNPSLGICDKDCEQLGCDESRFAVRKYQRNSTLPKVHFGAYGSANTVLKSGADRDRLTKSDGLIAFEMEASGVWEVYPTILIKAACDYADSHKNKKWQGYAASVAAACLKAFIEKLELPDEEISTKSQKSTHHNANYAHSVIGTVEKQRSTIVENKNLTPTPVGCLETMISKNTSNTNDSKSVQEISSTNIVPFSLPYLEAENYIDRPQETGTLERWLIHNTEPTRRRARLFAIHGLGGVGKTQLMINYAGKHRQDYTAILWFNGSSHTTFQQSFVENALKIPSTKLKSLASKLLQSESTLSRGQGHFQNAENNSGDLLDELVSATIDWLNSSGNMNWLLLFDNVDRRFPSDTDAEAFDVFAYIRRLVHGSVIMTTRYLPYCRPPMTLTLDSMTEDQALRYLASCTGQDSKELPEDAKVLVNILGYLPLALSHASSFIFQNRYTFSQYLSIYKTERLKLMDQDFYPSFAGDYSNGSVATTWTLSYNHMKSHDPLSAQFLQILAYFQCNDISFEIFKSNNGASVDEYINAWVNPPELVKKLYSFTSFTTLIRPLIAYAFLYPQASGLDGFRIHPLIQDWCLFTSTPKESHEHFISALQILSISSEKTLNSEGGLYTRNLKHRLGNHAARCLEMLSPDIETINGSNDLIYQKLWILGQLFCAIGGYRYAIFLYRKSFEGFKKENGLRDEKTRRCAKTLAWLLIQFKNYEETEFMLNEILSSYDILEAEQDDSHTILTFALARTHEKLGNLTEADVLSKQTMQRINTRNGLQTSAIMALKLEIADFLSEQGRHEEAIQLITDLLATHVEWDVSTKFHRWLALDQLNSIYWGLKRVSEIIPILEGSLLKWENTYGYDDQYPFMILRRLGFGYLHVSQWDKAENIWRKLEQNPDLYDPEHFRLQAQHCIGRCLYMKNCLGEAEAVLRAVLERRVELLGEKALDTADTRYMLALVLRDQSRFALAEDLFRKAITDRKSNQGDPVTLILTLGKIPEEDDLVLQYTYALGYNQMLSGKLSEAQTIFEEVIRIRKLAFGMGDEDISRIQRVLATTYREQTDFATAETIARQAFEGGIQVFGRGHRETLRASAELSQNLQLLMRHKDAEALLRDDLAIKMASNDIEEIEKSGTMRHLAQVLEDTGKYEEAERLYLRALAIRESTEGIDHENTLNVVTDLASFYRGRGKYSSEEPLRRRLCETRKVAPGRGSETYLHLFSLGNCYLYQCQANPSKLPLAIAAFEEGHSLGKEVLGMDHLIVLQMGLNMALAYRKNHQLNAAIEILGESIVKGMSLYPDRVKSNLYDMVEMQADMYWDQKKHEEARLSYRRAVATCWCFNSQFPLEQKFFVRGDINRDELPKFLRMLAMTRNEMTKQNEPYNTFELSCDGCEARFATSQTTTNRFHYCLDCSEADFCDVCFQNLQSGIPFPVCSPSHRFLEVSKNFWSISESPSWLVDEHGVTLQEWLDRNIEKFLNEMRRDDATWMDWISTNSGP